MANMIWMKKIPFWRDSSCTLPTFCIDGGMNATETRAVTGHKSEAALSLYVANSSVQKNRASEAIALTGTKR